MSIFRYSTIKTGINLVLVAGLLFLGSSKASAETDSVDSLMAHMSLREKVGQLFILEYTKHTTWSVIRNKIGGVILMESSIEKYPKKMNRLQRFSKIPLVVSIDGEWGAAMRFDTLTQFPLNMQMGALTEPTLVYEAGLMMAKQFRRLGVNINFAPSIDINSNPLNPAIGQRSFGDDREKVAIWGSALIKGLQDGGVYTSAKHFPGHGDTSTDSHKVLPLLPHSRNRLDSLELYPFQKTIDNGVDMVMVGHLNVPALDSTGTPSSISYPIITELLRKQMGFNGIIITDALAMKGVSEHIPPETVALESFKAGSDILLMPPKRHNRSIRNVLRAVRRGEISRERLDSSVRKILQMKQKMEILNKTPRISAENIFAETETQEVLNFIQKICDESVTMVKEPTCDITSLISTNKADTITLSKYISREILDSVKTAAMGKECIVLFLPQLRAKKLSKELYSTIPPQEVYDYICSWATEQRIILAIMDTPYVLNKIDHKVFEGIILGYNPTPANARSVWKVLTHQIPAKGVLPVVTAP